MQEQPYFEKDRRIALYQYIFQSYSQRAIQKARSLTSTEQEAQTYAAMMLEKIYIMYSERLDFRMLDNEAYRIVENQSGVNEAIAYFTAAMRREKGGSMVSEPTPVRAQIDTQPAVVVESVYQTRQDPADKNTVHQMSKTLDKLLKELDDEQPRFKQNDPKPQSKQPPQEQYRRPVTTKEESKRAAAATRTTKPAPQQTDKQPARTVEPFKKKLSINWIVIVVICLVLSSVTWIVVGLLTTNGIIPGVDLGYTWFNQNVFPLF